MSTQFNCQKYFYFKLFKQLYITIQFSVSTFSMSKTVQFQIIQFSISMPLVLFNPLIGPLSGATTPSQSGPGSKSNEGVLRITQDPSIIGT